MLVTTNQLQALISTLYSYDRAQVPNIYKPQITHQKQYTSATFVMAQHALEAS